MTSGRLGHALDPDDLRTLILAALPSPRAGSVPLAEAGGLILAADVAAPVSLPRFDNAAMDGYAVAATGWSGPVRLVVGRSLAGAPFRGVVGPGEAVAIATGAALPEGADAVVPLEEAVVEGELVALPGVIVPGSNVRLAGEDVAEGSVVLDRGQPIGPGQVAAAAALGLASLPVHPRPVVAAVPTGDEIRPTGAELREAETYDAVSDALAWLLADAGAVARLRPPAPDDAVALREALLAAAQEADAVLTVGGVSVGERDLLAELGPPISVTTTRVALHPARPFAYGTVAATPLWCLPGNPGAALAAFEQLVRPAVLALGGRPPAPRPSVTAMAAACFQGAHAGLHLVRALVWDEDGVLYASPAGRPGSAMMHALAAMNAWAVVPAGVAEIPAGAPIEVRRLTG